MAYGTEVYFVEKILYVQRNITEGSVSADTKGDERYFRQMSWLRERHCY